MTAAGDVIADIDALIAGQLDAGEPVGGYDYDDPDFPSCPWPGCREDWHGLRITTRMHEMRWHGAFTEGYRYPDDDSTVICPGGEFIGPPAPARALSTARLQSALISITPQFGRFAAIMHEAMTRTIDWNVLVGGWSALASFMPEFADSYTLRRTAMPPNPLLTEQTASTGDTAAAPDPIVDRAMNAHPPAPSVLDPDAQYSSGVVWIDLGRGFEAAGSQKNRMAPFGLSVSAPVDPDRRNPPQRTPWVTLHGPSGVVPVRWPGSSVRWEVSVSGAGIMHLSVPVAPPRREVALTPTYRCARPGRIEQSRPWVREQSFDRRGRGNTRSNIATLGRWAGGEK